MDLEGAAQVAADADAQLEQSRKLLESLRANAEEGAASLHSPRDRRGGAGPAAGLTMAAPMGLQLGVPSRGGEHSPLRPGGRTGERVLESLIVH